MTHMRVLSNVLCLAGICGAVLLAACGDTPPPKSPQQAPPVYAPMPTTTSAVPAQTALPAPTAAPNGPKQSISPQAAAFHQQGLTAFASGQLRQALLYFTQATQADSRAYQSFYSLGVIQERLDMAQALSSYQRAFALKSDFEAAICGYGLLLAKQGNASDADSFLTEKRGRMPKSARIAGALAEVKSLQKDTASAQQIAQEALKLDPDYRPAMMTIARDHYRNRRLDLALYALKAILDGFGGDNPPRDKNNAEAHLLRGFIWDEQGQTASAMKAFRRAIELRPDMVVARLRLANYLLGAGDAQEALPILQWAVRYDDDNLAVHLSLGDAYRLLGQFTKAKQEFEWVRGRDGSLPQVHYNLGLLYLFASQIQGMTKKQQIEAAIESLNKYKELRRKTDPEDHEELLKRATLKKAELDALEAASRPQPVPAATPTPPATAAPPTTP